MAGTLGARLEADEAMRRWINEQIVDAAPRAIERYREDIRRYIVERVGQWNAEEMSVELEKHIGRDLQFIRVNGTLVGGLVGLAIHAVDPGPGLTPCHHARNRLRVSASATQNAATVYTTSTERMPPPVARPLVHEQRPHQRHRVGQRQPVRDRAHHTRQLLAAERTRPTGTSSAS